MNDLPIKVYAQRDSKANETMLVNCELQINEYFKTKIFQLSDSCFNVIKGKYLNTAFMVDDGDFVLLTLKKAILIRNSNSTDKIKIIAGKNTKINNLTSLAVGKIKKNIVVVDNHKSVLVFDHKINGDVGPIVNYSIDKIQKSESIEIDEDRRVIKIFDADHGLVQEFALSSE